MNNVLDILPHLCFGLVFVLGITACAEGDAPNLAVGSAINEFGVNLFHEVRSQHAEEPNVVVSPVSAALALGMTAMGADGETRNAMRQALRLPEATDQDLIAAYRQFLQQVHESDTSVTLDIANSLWLNQMYAFNNSYLDQVSDCFKAELARLDFGNPASRDRINNWVGEATNGKIDQIIDAIEPELAMILINALYFKADWHAQFDTARTREQPFTLWDGSTVDHPLMRVTNRFWYLETPEMEMIELPYKGQQQSMFVLLPTDSLSVGELLARLTIDWWDQHFNELKPQKGTLTLPKFKLTSDYILNNALKNLGMEIAFAPGRADFSPMLADPEDPSIPGLYISEVRQKTYIDVVETGTEAAAATSVAVRVTAVIEPDPPRFEMRVDRPFVFVLLDETSRTMLFVGRVGDPRQ